MDPGNVLIFKPLATEMLEDKSMYLHVSFGFSSKCLPHKKTNEDDIRQTDRDTERVREKER